jgi:SM-20-related protein
MHTLEKLFLSLEEHGWATADEAVPAKLVADLLLECQKSWQEGLFHEAHIGRGEEKSRHEDIRGDSILWLNNGQNAAAAEFLLWAAELRRALNERYFLGLRQEEFHFARYPVGKGYRKHLDQHRGRGERKISLVLYLNPQWGPADGGELCLDPGPLSAGAPEKIRPQGGRLVLFRSDLIPHEVLPCFQVRWSLTGWFRTD